MKEVKSNFKPIIGEQLRLPGLDEDFNPQNNPDNYDKPVEKKPEVNKIIPPRTEEIVTIDENGNERIVRYTVITFNPEALDRYEGGNYK